MVYKLNVSKETHRDVDEIVSYFVYELKNAEAAISFLNDVENSYCHVKVNPFMFSLCGDERLRQEGYRKIPIKNYLVIYRVNEAQKDIFVVRIIYGPRDYVKLL